LRQSIAVIAALLLTIAVSSRAAADEDPDKLVALQRHFESGRSALANDRLGEAIEAFRAAARLAGVAAVHFNLADALSRSGNLREAAHELELCLSLAKPPTLTDAELTELQDSLAAFEYDNPKLRLAGTRAAEHFRSLPDPAIFKPPLSTYRLPLFDASRDHEPRYVVGRRRSSDGTAGRGLRVAGSIQIAVGAVLALLGAAGVTGGAVAGYGRTAIPNSFYITLVEGGGAGLMIGLGHISAGMALVIRSNHPRHNTAQPEETVLATSSELDARIRRARRTAIGGGVAAGLSLALAITGAALLGSTVGSSPRLVTEFDRRDRFYQSGGALLGIGSAGVLIGLGVVAYGASRWRSLRGTDRTRAYAAAPWVTADSAGLSFAGTF
jgi:hypothetical protein